MAKYHVGINGKPATCTAQPGRCPRGSEDSHYSTLESASIASEKKGMKTALKSREF